MPTWNSVTASDPASREITQKSREILSVILGGAGINEILSSPLFRTHIMTVRSRHVLGSENRGLLATGLASAALLNTVSRRTLGWFFERALFYDQRDEPPFFHVSGFPLQRIPISTENLFDAVIATGSIPLVLSGVRNIAGASPGVYRDGGVIDYHLDLPHSADEKLTLFPHFYDHIVPGWFDKRLKWRKPHPGNVDRTILVSPSAEFVAKLPNAKIPDRRDFLAFSPRARETAWRACVAACAELADEFNEVMTKDSWRQDCSPCDNLGCEQESRIAGAGVESINFDENRRVSGAHLGRTCNGLVPRRDYCGGHRLCCVDSGVFD